MYKCHSIVTILKHFVDMFTCKPVLHNEIFYMDLVFLFLADAALYKPLLFGVSIFSSHLSQRKVSKGDIKVGCF